MKKWKKSKSVRLERQAIRSRYMELTLYPDEYKGTNSARLKELSALRGRIKRFRYRSIRNFINEVFDDASLGFYSDPVREIFKVLRGGRDRIKWEEIAGGHQLTVNALSSPWVDIKLPAECCGYMAIRTGRREVRIMRVFNVQNFEIKRD